MINRTIYDLNLEQDKKNFYFSACFLIRKQRCLNSCSFKKILDILKELSRQIILQKLERCVGHYCISMTGLIRIKV
jgi:hypothetical protein